MPEPTQESDPYVSVPGQFVWHTHTCDKCGHAWTHKAPTPMRSSVNERIHTCTVCGTRVANFTYDYFDNPFIVLGVLGAGVLLWLMCSRLLTTPP